MVFGARFYQTNRIWATIRNWDCGTFLEAKIKWEKRTFPIQRASIILIIALFFLLLLCFSYYCFVFLIVDSVLCNFLPINEYVIREIIDILVVVLR
ncbi:MAG: hypothetical protein CMQ19_06500 [Gammaproteobacteria bacterium]|nr:hypothetical protein [Gammaproteobacteria bacterium]